MLRNARVPILGFAAYSGTGKTTLLEQLLPRLRAHGLHLAVVKHTHHDLDIDHPGKDSDRLRKAGALQTLVASHKRWALITEVATPADEPKLDDLLLALDQARLDLILVEGFKHEAYPRVELHRAALGHPYMFPTDPHIIAIASDAPVQHPRAPQRLDLNNPEQIAEFVAAYV